MLVYSHGNNTRGLVRDANSLGFSLWDCTPSTSSNTKFYLNSDPTLLFRSLCLTVDPFSPGGPGWPISPRSPWIYRSTTFSHGTSSCEGQTQTQLARIKQVIYLLSCQARLSHRSDETHQALKCFGHRVGPMYKWAELEKVNVPYEDVLLFLPWVQHFLWFQALPAGTNTIFC